MTDGREHVINSVVLAKEFVSGVEPSVRALFDAMNAQAIEVGQEATAEQLEAAVGAVMSSVRAGITSGIAAIVKGKVEVGLEGLEEEARSLHDGLNSELTLVIRDGEIEAVHGPLGLDAEPSSELIVPLILIRVLEDAITGLRGSAYGAINRNGNGEGAAESPVPDVFRDAFTQE